MRHRRSIYRTYAAWTGRDRNHTRAPTRLFITAC